MDTGEDRPAKVRRLGGDGAAPEEVAARAPGRVTVVEQDGKSCMHQVMVPDEWTGELGPPAARPGPAAKEYPFQIDPFQQTSINCLEAGHSVLVAAHTSAGKTVVAQYAIAMALRDKSRVVYTSPLKALSNQKYREFFEEFGDVGLITGDVMINPNASCLVMTTEILRSMLYSGSDVVSEVQLVVYDEIHYMRDKERGVVWEESLILLPPACQMAFLSATLPNAQDFAQWIANLHKKACHVVSTDFRPTPLVHYLFPCGAEQLYMAVDQRSNFNEANFSKAVAALSDSGTAGGGQTGKKGAKDTGAGEQSDMLKIVRMILSRQLQPAIVFSFSKKDCEALAMQMQTLDLTSEEEKKNVDLIYRAAMDSLSIQDRRLPQIVHLLPVLRRGVGLHHSGLLPIVKEVIEILFQEGLLKVLFATETFSTGLNMPARTVVFANVRKFDGGTFRWISSGEYVQMSGRAGRRGLDDKGVVILMLDTKMEPAVAKNMLRGQPDPLHSEFHLSYNMLLSMLRHPGPLAGPEELMQRSFRQFQAQAELPTLQKRADDLLAEHNAVEVPEEEQVIQYLLLLQQLQAVQDEIRGVLTQPKYALPFLQPGRLVKLVQPPDGCAEAARSRGGEGAESSGNVPATAEACVLPGTVWAVVVNFERRETASARNGTAHETDSHGGDGSGDAYTVDVLASVWKDEGGAAGGGVVRSRMAQLASQQESPASTTAKVVGVPLAAVQAMSTARIYLHKDLRAQEHRQAAIKCLAEAVHRLERKQGSVPLLDPVRDMKVECGRYRKAAKKAAKIRQLLGSHPLHNNPQLPAWLRKLQGKQDLATAVRAARREVKAAKGLILKDDLKHRRRCLRRLGFVDEDGVVTLKGRVACELQSCDELVLAELLLGGMFQTWGPATIVAVISTFIWQEKVGSGAALSEEMQRALASIRDVARRIGKVQEEAGMAVELDAYVQSFSSDLMPVAAAWAEGAAFADIVKQTDVFEGSLVRAVRRLEEVLRQMVSAAQVVGDDALASKFTTCIERVKRDIVFAASLYL